MGLSPNSYISSKTTKYMRGPSRFSFNELDVGYCAYYWMPSDAGWTPEQGMFTDNSANYWPVGQSSPTQSIAGNIFINNNSSP